MKDVFSEFFERKPGLKDEMVDALESLAVGGGRAPWAGPEPFKPVISQSKVNHGVDLMVNQMQKVALKDAKAKEAKLVEANRRLQVENAKLKQEQAVGANVKLVAEIQVKNSSQMKHR